LKNYRKWTERGVWNTGNEQGVFASNKKSLALNDILINILFSFLSGAMVPKPKRPIDIKSHNGTFKLMLVNCRQPN
jgi:hypothetical protein